MTIKDNDKLFLPLISEASAGRAFLILANKVSRSSSFPSCRGVSDSTSRQPEIQKDKIMSQNATDRTQETHKMWKIPGSSF